ncbi:hypothetical protein [Microvirga splendida]|uniref:Uncharacterized protein n=1 Tax=Microvirga splendida TaxID=2795727 RepID=A0ABS0Y5H9_9HYPH|nr:hypothetical protein [Microvirga splendida]MBJ6127534.1 hypothetical protein [Microvirga splendida]
MVKTETKDRAQILEDQNDRQSRKRARDEAHVAHLEAITAKTSTYWTHLDERDQRQVDLIARLTHQVNRLERLVLGDGTQTSASGASNVLTLPAEVLTQLVTLKCLENPSREVASDANQPEPRFLGLSAMDLLNMPDEFLGVFGLRETVARWTTRIWADESEVEDRPVLEEQAALVNAAPWEPPYADNSTDSGPKDKPDDLDHVAFGTSTNDQLSGHRPIEFEKMQAAYSAWRDRDCPFGPHTRERGQWLKDAQFPYAGLLWRVSYEKAETQPDHGMIHWNMTFTSDDGRTLVGLLVRPRPARDRAA